MKSRWAKPGSFEQKWYLYDAENVILGRLASKIAMTLMGKNKPIYTPSIDTGDFVVVVNADKIATLNGDVNVPGSVDKKIKDYVDKFKSAREAKEGDVLIRKVNEHGKHRMIRKETN